MKIVKGVLVILLFVLCVILVYQNTEALFTKVLFQVNLRVLNIQYSTPVWAMILIFFFLGVIALAVFSMVDRYKIKRELTAIKRAIREKDKELNSLRNLPLTSTDLPGFNENGK